MMKPNPFDKLDTIQKRNNLNTVYRDGKPGPGGAYHDYVVSFGSDTPESDSDMVRIQFQCGPALIRLRGRAYPMPTCWRLFVTSFGRFRPARFPVGRMLAL